MKEDRNDELANRQGISPNLVDAVRQVLAGKRDEEPVVEAQDEVVDEAKQPKMKNTKTDIAGAALDPVDKRALKGKHKDRKDKDIDNDGDVDDSDKYLHKRRKAVAKAMEAKEYCDCDCDCGKKVCESCDKPHKPEDIEEDAQMVRGADGQVKYKTSRMPLSLQRMARRKRPLAKRIMRSKVQVNSYDPTEVSEDYGATQNAKAHAKKDGANYNDQSVAHKYNAYHMKKAGYTHFQNQRMGVRKYNKSGIGTKIGPEHHKGISEDTMDEGAMSRIATQSAEKKRLGADKVKGSGLDTFKKKPAKDTLIANPRNQRVRKVTPSRAKMAVKKGFVYAEHMEGLEEADAFKGQPVGVSVTMKHKSGKKVTTKFPGTHSAVAGAKSHISQMQKKGYSVHSKDLMYGKNEAIEKVNEARRGRPAKTPAAGTQDTETRHNIIHQLRKSVSLRGQHKVEFKDGKSHKVSQQHAAQALNKYNSLRTTGEKANYQKQLHHSHDSFHTARQSKTPGAAPKKPGVSLGGSDKLKKLLSKD